MLTNTIIREHNQSVLIANALLNKSRRSFRGKKNVLVEQANYFSPAYRDFIFKIIDNKSLKIVQNSDGGHISPVTINESNRLNSKKVNRIGVNIFKPWELSHELGHAVDLWFGHNKTLTTSVIIKDDKTLFDIFNEELQEKKEELYKMVMDEYKESINHQIGPDAFDIIMNGIDDYRQLLRSMDSSERLITNYRHQLQKQLYDSGFMETYYQLYEHRSTFLINMQYSLILDALSSQYNLTGLGLHSHSLSYYEKNKTRAVEEFFANLFAAKVTSNHACIDMVIKHLPKSFDAFERLFVIFYDHIQNNKRFTDVKIK